MFPAIVTFQDGVITDGAEVGLISFSRKSRRKYPAVTIGEKNTSSESGVRIDWRRIQKVGRLFAAGLGFEKIEFRGNDGKVKEVKEYPRLLAADRSLAEPKKGVIAVFKTDVGWRGSNSLDGDPIGHSCANIIDGQGPCPYALDEPIPPARCPVCGHDEFEVQHHPFPGQILAETTINKGAGQGKHTIALVEPLKPFKVSVLGTILPPKNIPAEMYYYINKEGTIESATWEDRVPSDDSDPKVDW